jgi:6-phosphofructokinase 1
MGNIRTIGVLTSGGDAPGMNAAIRAVVRAGIYYGYKVMGIKRGFTGLVSGDMEELTLRAVSGIIQHGGTMLKTSRCPEFKTKEGIFKGVSMCKIFGIDVVVVIGGDGSFRGALDLSKAGIPVIGIPATIDNDVGCTDYTIGFDTALNTVSDALDKIKDTGYSHERVSVLEVMGRKAGHIAINTGIAGGAEVILIPEETPDYEKDVIRPILEGRNRGKTDFNVIVAEGVDISVPELSRMIEESTGITTRYTILGYIQRGGIPTVNDRVMASRMGVKAVKDIREGKLNRVIAYKNGKVVDFDIEEALKQTKNVDEEMIELERILSL